MKKLMFFSVALFLVGLNWQCERTTDVPNHQQAAFGDTLQFTYGQTITLLPGNLEVRFDSVTQDSRCPLDVVCVWAGMAEVKLWFKQDQVEQTGLLNTLDDPGSITVFGKTVRLIDVTPYPQTPGEIPQADYKIRIVVE
ncbi:MAG: hypothetical protein SH848_04470 [Saprospiraceae bacterium]|nr:hypothetical protein [Saprospiraceae bacterium]MDZ4703157.1 hypothetical protein [Saprospiraceae bacterium]